MRSVTTFQVWVSFALCFTDGWGRIGAPQLAVFTGGGPGEHQASAKERKVEIHTSIRTWPQHFSDMNSSGRSQQKFLTCCLRGLNSLKLWDLWLHGKPWSPSEKLREPWGKEVRSPKRYNLAPQTVSRGQVLNLEPTHTGRLGSRRHGSGCLSRLQIWVFSGLFFLSASPAFCVRIGSGAHEASRQERDLDLRSPDLTSCWGTARLPCGPQGRAKVSRTCPNAFSPEDVIFL